MNQYNGLIRITLTVALGGLLMGFDASVISGVVKFIETDFALTKLELGWAVASLTLTATLAMMIAGPLSDKYGRRTILKYAAVLYAISAIASALAPSFTILVIARMIGGFGVGASLIIAPMYIAEIAPAAYRGRLVSFNQLNIVIGISLAFFTNYFILQLGKSDASWALGLKFAEYNWRWMLGIEAIPAIFYFLGLYLVPRSPRWLLMKGEGDEALSVLTNIANEDIAKADYEAMNASIEADKNKEKGKLSELFKPALRIALSIGIVVAILQQITGINSVFFYAPMIFEQSGIGTDASFIQAILVGLTNLVFTVLAIMFIDRIGRRPLLIFGVSGIAISMLVLAYSFGSATYQVKENTMSYLATNAINNTDLSQEVYDSDKDFKEMLVTSLGSEEAAKHESEILKMSINIQSIIVLMAIIGFVASFAISIGPVMWVLFSELFPNRIRGVAISFVGLINSAISFLVQWIFPWELANFGTAMTFLIYGLFAVLGLIFIIRVIPETKGKSLEELEEYLNKTKV